MIFWALLEASVGLICISLPCLRLILKRVWPHAFGRKKTSNDQVRGDCEQIEHKRPEDPAIRNQSSSSIDWCHGAASPPAEPTAGGGLSNDEKAGVSANKTNPIETPI
jgi:hypothetical protein